MSRLLPPHWLDLILLKKIQGDTIFTFLQKKLLYSSTTFLQMILPLSQIINHFGFFRCIVFAMLIDIYIMSRCIAKSIYLEKPKRLIIWDAGSICSRNFGSNGSVEDLVMQNFSTLKIFHPH